MTFQRVAGSNAVPTVMQQEQQPIPEVEAGKVKAHTRTSKKGKKYAVKEHGRKGEKKLSPYKQRIVSGLKKAIAEFDRIERSAKQKSKRAGKKMYTVNAPQFGIVNSRKKRKTQADREISKTVRGKLALRDKLIRQRDAANAHGNKAKADKIQKQIRKLRIGGKTGNKIPKYAR